MLQRLLAVGIGAAVSIAACSPAGLKPLPSSTGGSSEQAGAVGEAGGTTTDAAGQGGAFPVDTGAGGTADGGGTSDDAGAGGTSTTQDGAAEAGDSGSLADGSANAGGSTKRDSGAGAGGSTPNADSASLYDGGPIPRSCGMPVVGGGGVAQPSGTAGNLKVLDWAGFKAAYTFTFDDANSSQLLHYDELNALGVPMTFFLVGASIGTNQAKWAKAAADGHELANHTQSHGYAYNSTVARSVVQADVDLGKKTIESAFSLKVYTMAAPGGDPAFGAEATAGHFMNRSLGTSYMRAGNDSSPSAFNTYCYLPSSGAAASTLESNLIDARAAGAWGCMVIHGFKDGGDGAYQPIPFDAFTTTVNYAKGLGDMWLDTFENVGAYWRGQVAFEKNAPATSGTTQTWTWTLPSNFPTGKCLRVTVDGGTVQQGGKTVPWDGHGYYEISLDEGLLTLSP